MAGDVGWADKDASSLVEMVIPPACVEGYESWQQARRSMQASFIILVDITS